MNLGVLQKAVNVLRSCGTVSFSRRTLLHGVSQLMSGMWSGVRTKWQKMHRLVHCKAHESVLSARGTGNGYDGAGGDVVAQGSGFISVNKLIQCHIITERCNSTVQDLPCNIHIYPAGPEIPTFHATRRSITVFTKVPRPESFLSSPNLPLRHILIQFHLFLGIANSQAKII
jgi:hypothetical protein